MISTDVKGTKKVKSKGTNVDTTKRIWSFLGYIAYIGSGLFLVLGLGFIVSMGAYAILFMVSSIFSAVTGIACFGLVDYMKIVDDLKRKCTPAQDS